MALPEKKADASGKKAQRKDVRFSNCWVFCLFVLGFLYPQLKAKKISLLDYKERNGWAQSRTKLSGIFFFFIKTLNISCHSYKIYTLEVPF